MVFAYVSSGVIQSDFNYCRNFPDDANTTVAETSGGGDFDTLILQTLDQ